MAPDGYLRSVLADGERPFRARAAVRELLGVPADTGVRVGFPVLPRGLGFVYRREAAFAAGPAQAGSYQVQVVDDPARYLGTSEPPARHPTAHRQPPAAPPIPDDPWDPPAVAVPAPATDSWNTVEVTVPGMTPPPLADSAGIASPLAGIVSPAAPTLDLRPHAGPPHPGPPQAGPPHPGASPAGLPAGPQAAGPAPRAETPAAFRPAHAPATGSPVLPSPAAVMSGGSTLRDDAASTPAQAGQSSPRERGAGFHEVEHRESGLYSPDGRAMTLPPSPGRAARPPARTAASPSSGARPDAGPDTWPDTSAETWPGAATPTRRPAVPRPSQSSAVTSQPNAAPQPEPAPAPPPTPPTVVPAVTPPAAETPPAFWQRRSVGRLRARNLR